MASDRTLYLCHESPAAWPFAHCVQFNFTLIVSRVACSAMTVCENYVVSAPYFDGKL